MTRSVPALCGPGSTAPRSMPAAGKPGCLERPQAAIAIGRGGEPEEVARAIAWLCSDRASAQERCASAFPKNCPPGLIIPCYVRRP